MDACSAFQADFDVSDPTWASNSTFGIVNQSVGYLLSMDKDWIILGAEMDQSGRPRDIMNIPTTLALEMIQLVPPTDKP